MIRFRSGLTLRISIAFACFAGVLLVGVGVTSYSSGRTALESAAVSELLSSAISKKSNINEWHRNAVADVEAIAASPALVAATTEMLSTNLPADITRQAHDRLVAELMPRTRLQSRRHLLIAIADPISGQIIAATQLSMEGQSVAQQLYFSIANKKSYVQNPTISTYLNRPVITIGTPIRAPNGMVRGVLLAWIDLSELNNIVQQRTGLHQSDDAYLVNPDHQYVTQPRFMKQAAVLTTKVYTEGVDRALTGYSGILLASDYNEVPSIIVYRWLPNQRLGLITLITQEEALTLAKEFRIAILLTSVLVLLVASGISIALARTIVHPIRILQEGVSRFGQGEFALRLPVTFDNELGQLAREFNNMADAINQKGRELQQNASQLELRVQERTRTLKRQADLLELAHDAIIVRRADGTIDYWNHGAREMYGWAHNEARGRIIHDLLKTHFPIDLDEFNHELLKVGRWEGELVHTRRDGRTIVVVSRQAVRYDDKGTAIAILEINTDISERKIAETQLTLAKDAAEAATNAKSDFLANMSHEIRTPMNGVIGLTNLVLKTPLTDRQRDYLGLIKGSADSLLRLLNDILDFSKMEARKLELELIEFDLREELGNTLKAFSATANEKNIELIHHVMPGVPSWIVGDAGRLSQIIVNLTGNALKFTKEGEVVVRVLQEASDDQSVVLRFSVSDSGIGIPKEQQEIIFSAFAQADSSTTREFGGTGLGLAIVSQLVNLMHGKVWIDSAPGKGTTFHFTARFHLPAQQKLEAATYIAQRASLNNLAILVVDDNRTNRMILAEILSNWTMHPVLAGDADQALQLLQQQIEMQKSFPVVLLDMHMKDVNCYELAEAIKARSVGQVEFIMMMSANDMDDDIDRYRQIGIRNFLHKPIKQSELFDAIANVTGVATGQDMRRASTETQVLQRPARVLHVLIAEDNLVNQRLVSDILTERGHTFMIASNGLETLLLLEQQKFDVILMDGQMPEMDGYQAAREIRRREHGTDRHIRIIAVTAHAMKEDKALCLDAGMDDYVTKPIDADHLIGRIEWQSDQQSALHGSGAALHAASALETQPAVFDLEGALKRVRGKVPLLKELLAVLLQDLPKALEEIDKAVVNHDAAQLERTAHRLRGAVSTICAGAVTEAVSEIERLGRANTLAAAPTAVDNLHLHVAELVTEMHAYLGELA